MTNRRKKMIYAVAALAVAWVVAESYIRYVERTPKLPPPVTEARFPEVGSAAEDFSLPQAGSRQPMTLSQHRGKRAVYMYFWASWSPFSKDELRDLALVQDDFATSVAVLAINRGEDSSSAEDSALARGAEGYPLLLDAVDDVWRQYRGTVMPLHIFIDRLGVIREVRTGPLSLDEMRERVKRITVIE